MKNQIDLQALAIAVGGTLVVAQKKTIKPAKKTTKGYKRGPRRGPKVITPTNNTASPITLDELIPLLNRNLSSYIEKRGVDATIKLSETKRSDTSKKCKYSLSGKIRVHGLLGQHVDNGDFAEETHPIKIVYDLTKSIKLIHGETWEVHSGTVHISVGTSEDNKPMSVIFDDDTFLGVLATGKQLQLVGDIISDLVHDGVDL